MEPPTRRATPLPCLPLPMRSLAPHTQTVKEGSIVTPSSRGIAREIEAQSETVARQFPKIAHLMREASVLIADQQSEIERLRKVRNRLLNNRN